MASMALSPMAALVGDPATFQKPASRIPARYRKFDRPQPSSPNPTRGVLQTAKVLHSMGVHLLPDSLGRRELSADEVWRQLNVLDSARMRTTS
eukprot:4581614-Prymnesium_polylepis.1